MSFISPDAHSTLNNVMGWRLSAINGIVSSDLTLDQIIEKLSMTQRPLTMTFIKGSSKHDLEDIREQIQKTEQSVLQKEPGSPERVRMERHANEMKKKQEPKLKRKSLNWRKKSSVTWTTFAMPLR